VSFITISKILKTLEAWVILSINITFAPTLIFGITNGIGFRMIGFSKAFTEMVTTTRGISTCSMAKGKVQEIMANYVPPFDGFKFHNINNNRFVSKLVAIANTYIGENF